MTHHDAQRCSLHQAYPNIFIPSSNTCGHRFIPFGPVDPARLPAPFRFRPRPHLEQWGWPPRRTGRVGSAGSANPRCRGFAWAEEKDPNTPWDWHICRSVGVVSGVNVGIYGIHGASGVDIQSRYSTMSVPWVYGLIGAAIDHQRGDHSSRLQRCRSTSFNGFWAIQRQTRSMSEGPWKLSVKNLCAAICM